MKKKTGRYPKKLEGGLLLRPMESRDEKALLAFFKTIPVDERHLFKDDVTNPKVIAGWARKLDFSRVLPLLVLDGKRVVADATLHREKGGWSRHVGKIRLTIDPAYRGRGLGQSLVREFMNTVAASGTAILQAEILTVQTDATRLFENLGFHCVATLPQNVIDLAGKVRDLAVYAFTTTPPERLSSDAAVKEADADIGGG